MFVQFAWFAPVHSGVAGPGRSWAAPRRHTQEPGCREPELPELGDNLQNGHFKSEYFYPLAMLETPASMTRIRLHCDCHG